MATDFREHESRSPWNWTGIHYFKYLVTFFHTVTMKWATLFADGTAAAPGVAFDNDTDTGLYRATTNEIGLVTAGTERVRVDASGNIGVNVAAPSQSGQTNAAPLLNIHSTTAGAFPSLVLTTSQTGINECPGIVVFGTTGTPGTEKRSGAIIVVNTAAATTNITSSMYFYTTNANTIGLALTLDNLKNAIIGGNMLRITAAKTPANATDTGTAGQICWDASYIYVCTQTNVWKRAAISTWP